MALPPGPRSPAAVNIVRFARQPLETLRAWRGRYGDVFTVRLLGFGTGVYVADPEAMKRANATAAMATIREAVAQLRRGSA